MDMSREEFVVFIRQAINDSNSVAGEELYQFLVNCFVRADTAGNGKVDITNFDRLIDEAAELPRRYGYAPKSEVMFSSEGMRKAARAKQFMDMDTDGSGYITMDKWIAFANTHIKGKIANLPKDYLSGTAAEVTKEEFITFIRSAVDKSTPEYRELYFFLLKTFQKGDRNRTGKVGPVTFDLMIEDAAAAPRRYGLAPKSSEMFKNQTERLNKRKEIFASMDPSNTGTISFNEWLDYAWRHIVGKVATLR